MSLEEGTAAGQLSGGEHRTGKNADSSRTSTVVEIKEVINSIKEGSRSPHVKKILTKPLGTTESWITFVSWIISISIDPLFCYIAVINDEKKLLEINKSLLIVLDGYRFRIVQQVLAGSLDSLLIVQLVGSGGVNIGAASVEIGSASVVGNIGDELNVESTENEEVIESDYEQEPEDIAANTCVDPTRDWESLQVAVIPHAECGSGSDLDLGSDDLRSLDGSDGEEDDGGPRRKFIKTNYHEFNPRCDLQDPIFRVGMEFGSADLFRKANRAHAVKHRRVVILKPF
ncbi:hypothetical protein LWI29_031606 [Acer saccharum]|uniref:Uncharacterized protein n=1 Tax=Acer saccharum TaxID=4024 RepID=A0AA39SHC8_ACESA|nr:hypothetical protein LWI29_031606 [Acer saccharum]